jgi:hypothetical protein
VRTLLMRSVIHSVNRSVKHDSMARISNMRDTLRASIAIPSSSITLVAINVFLSILLQRHTSALTPAWWRCCAPYTLQHNVPRFLAVYVLKRVEPSLHGDVYLRAKLAAQVAQIRHVIEQWMPCNAVYHGSCVTPATHAKRVQLARASAVLETASDNDSKMLNAPDEPVIYCRKFRAQHGNEHETCVRVTGTPQSGWVRWVWTKLGSTYHDTWTGEHVVTAAAAATDSDAAETGRILARTAQYMQSVRISCLTLVGIRSLLTQPFDVIGWVRKNTCSVRLLHGFGLCLIVFRGGRCVGCNNGVFNVFQLDRVQQQQPRLVQTSGEDHVAKDCTLTQSMLAEPSSFRIGLQLNDAARRQFCIDRRLDGLKNDFHTEADAASLDNKREQRFAVRIGSQSIVYSLPASQHLCYACQRLSQSKTFQNVSKAHEGDDAKFWAHIQREPSACCPYASGEFPVTAVPMQSLMDRLAAHVPAVAPRAAAAADNADAKTTQKTPLEKCIRELHRVHSKRIVNAASLARIDDLEHICAVHFRQTCLFDCVQLDLANSVVEFTVFAAQLTDIAKRYQAFLFNAKLLVFEVAMELRRLEVALLNELRAVCRCADDEQFRMHIQRIADTVNDFCRLLGKHTQVYTSSSTAAKTAATTTTTSRTKTSTDDGKETKSPTSSAAGTGDAAAAPDTTLYAAVARIHASTLRLAQSSDICDGTRADLLGTVAAHVKWYANVTRRFHMLLQSPARELRTLSKTTELWQHTSTGAAAQDVLCQFVLRILRVFVMFRQVRELAYEFLSNLQFNPLQK